MGSKMTIDTGSDDLLAVVEEGVAVLTMNRPERRNALSGGMLEGMARALELAETSDDVGCVVLTGAGGAFCSGGDVKGMAQSEGSSRKTTLDEAIRLHGGDAQAARDTYSDLSATRRMNLLLYLLSL